MSAQNREKLTPLSALTQLPPVRTHRKFRKIRGFLYQAFRTSVSKGPSSPTPLVRKMSALDNPLTADVFYGRPLIILFVRPQVGQITQQLTETQCYVFLRSSSSTKAMKTEQLLCWSFMTDTEHSTSGSNEEVSRNLV